MEVGESIRHALNHWDAGELEASMLHACNAVDGTGGKAFPALGVGPRFKAMIRSNLDIFGAWASPGIDLGLTRFPVHIERRPTRHGPPTSPTLSTGFIAAPRATVTHCSAGSS